MVIVVNVTINPEIAMPNEKSVFKLEMFLPFRLLNVSETLSLRFAESYRNKYSMTRPEWRAFAILGEHDEITATDIGQISHMHKTKVSRAIASLANRGWLTRDRDPADRRVEHLSLSTKGMRAYENLTIEASRYTQEIESQLGPEAMTIVWKAIEHLDTLELKA